MKKVIFVGVHNKPGKPPLDSSTTSGKRIDLVIQCLKGCDCIKTNLFEIERQPEQSEMEALKDQWFEKYKPSGRDIIVLLGSQVQLQFVNLSKSKIIRLAHPSLQYANISAADYIKNAVSLIKKAL